MHGDETLVASNPRKLNNDVFFFEQKAKITCGCIAVEGGKASVPGSSAPPSICPGALSAWFSNTRCGAATG